MRPSAPPPVVFPSGPGGVRRRRRRALIAGGVLATLVVLGTLVVALVLERHPEAPARLRALVAGGVRRARPQLAGGADVEADEGRPGRGARLACAPAVSVGAAGEVRALAQLAAGARATALFQWPRDAADAAAERRAVRELAGRRGLAVTALGRRGALAVTADGAALRALAGGAPGGSPQLAAAGTRALCVLD